MTAARKRGQSALSRYLAERAAQREAERDRPDASASPVEDKPIAGPRVVPEPKPARRRRQVRPASEVQAMPESSAEVLGAAKKGKGGRRSKVDQFADKIGVLPDVDLAALAGVAVTTARNWRMAKGFPAVRGEAKTGRAPSTQRSKIEAFLDKIGVVADSEVAALAGLTRAAVQNYRKRRGIPAAKVTMPKVRAVRPAKVVRQSRIAPFIDKLGVLPDGKVAALAGVRTGAVQAWRTKRGIPPATVRKAALPAAETPAPVGSPEVPAQVETPVEPVAIPIVEEPEPVEQVPHAGTATRIVRLTDRVEGMLEALAKARGIDLESAIAVAIAEDYLRCSPLMDEL